jgi:NAD-dependent dihydropyrimidine dehydrogenase PreA subunit
MNKIVVIDETLCIGCGDCVELCPKKILFIDETDNVCRVTDETQCDKLKGCERVCKTGAIKIY